MNKNLFLGMFAASTIVLSTSCSNEDIVSLEGDMVNVSFNLSTEGANASRAISDGSGADYLKYAVFQGTTQLDRLTTVERNLGDLQSGHAINLRLAKNQTYTVVFWAQDETCTAYDVSDDMKLTIDYEGVNNDETRDAFFNAKTITVTGDQSYDVELTRPFAQVNVGTADASDASNSGFEIKQSQMTFEGVATRLDLRTGVPSEPTNVAYSLNSIPEEALTVAGSDYKWLSMCYLLPNDKDGKVSGKATFNFKPEAGEDIALEAGLQNTPIQRNYRTNIVGNILTNHIDFSIVIDSEFKDPDHIVSLPWDGSTVEAPSVVNGKYVITTPAQFAWLNKRDIDKDVELAANIDLGGHSIYSMRTGNTAVTFDGKGFTISNYVQDYMLNGNYSKGLFTGEATHADFTVKNLTIDNAYVFNKQMWDGEGGYAGVVIGDTQDNVTYTLENVKVKNSFVKGVVAVGGLVGFHGSESNIIIKNCLVEETTIANQAVAYESGFVAGLIGRPVGSVTVDRSSNVDNCKLDAYYAGRRGQNSIALMIPGEHMSGTNNQMFYKCIDDAVFVSSVADFANCSNHKNVFLTKDIDCSGTTITPIRVGEVFDGNGFTLKNVSVATVGGGYAASLLDGQAPANETKVKNLNVDGYTAPNTTTFAGVICADIQNGLSLTIDNVNINNATVRSDKAAGGFVGANMSGETVIKNCSISNSNIYGMESRSAVVLGRTYSPSNNIERSTISINNVKLNDVLSTKYIGDADN